jgi:hypothetical protein
MAEQPNAGRELLAAIDAFARGHEQDHRLRDVLASLREARSSVERLVPTAGEDASEDSPGKRAAREASTDGSAQRDSSEPSSAAQPRTS